MTDQDTFVTTLRRHRERARIPLADIASRTHIKVELLEGFERNDLSTWPKGLYARAYIRAYASVIGLDPDDTVDEFCRLFAQGDRRSGGIMREMAGIVAAPSGWQDEFQHVTEDDRRRPPGMLRAPRKSKEPAASLGRFFYSVRALRTWALRRTETR